MVRNNITDIFNQAMFEGRKIDLSDCLYGPPHGRIPVPRSPYNYYYFLAGFVKTQGLICVLEIGTYFGGSIMSMSKGLSSEDMKKSCFVTVDITYENIEGFKKYPHIKRIHGGALDRGVVREVTECFDRDIDLLFIDSIHESWHVIECILLYANKLKPKYIVLDDIYCYGLKPLWKDLTKTFKSRAVDLTEICKREALAGKVSDGFGVIVCEYPHDLFRISKMYFLFSLAHPAYTIRRFLSRMLPGCVKDYIRKLLYI